MAGFGGITRRHRAAPPLPQHLYSEPVGSVEVDQAERRLDAPPALVTSRDSAVVRLAYGAVLVVLAFLMVGSWDYADALDAEAREKEERALAIIEESLAELAARHPLPYAATMRHCSVAWRECSEVRYYVPKGEQ